MADAKATLHAALDAGMTFIDTADVYGDGRSERIIREVLAERPDVIMLDNVNTDDMAEAVRRVKASAFGPVTLEASGGVNLTTVAAIAATGVDVISVGALTHSVPQLDVGLDAN